MATFFEKYSRNPYLVLTILYSIASIFILFDRGFFVDDWVIFNNSVAGVKDLFAGVGLWNTGIGHLHLYISGLAHSVLLYRLIIFGAYLLASLLFYKALTFFDFFNNTQRLVLALIFVALPFNSARITINCLHYAICFPVFLLAYVLFLQHLKNASAILQRCLALVFFFISFITNSFVIFYLVVPLTILFQHYQPGVPLLFYYKPLRKNADFILVPVVFVLLRSFWLKPEGLYKDSAYNSINIFRIIKTPFNLFKSFSESIFGLSKIVPPDFYFWIVPLGLIVYYGTVKQLSADQLNGVNNKKMTYAGLFLFLLGALPYCLVDKYPSFYGLYDSRHQLLLGFGASLLFLSAFNMIQLRYKNILLSVFIALLLLCQINLYLQYQFDAYRQESFIEKIKNDSTFREKHMIRLHDGLNKDNTLQWRFYALAGMVKKVYGTQHSLIIREKDYNMINEKIPGGIKGFAKEQYNLKDFQNGSFETTLYLDGGEVDYSIFTTLRMMYYQRFNKIRYRQELNRLTDYHFVPETAAKG